MELKQIAPEELRDIIRKHQDWIASKGIKGECADLSDTNLSEANLSCTNLNNINLSRADLSNANLSNANLCNASLDCANLSHANLAFVNFSKADLNHANLCNANLYCANLGNANLAFADLSYADLSDTDLRGADLSYADLSDTDLRGVTLYNAKGKVLSIGPIGSSCGITYAFWSNNDIYVQYGCFYGTLVQWEARCKETHDYNKHGRAYEAAATLIRTVADAYGWRE